MSRYLLTGCAGFIGANVADLLLRENHRVVGVDNLNDAYDVSLKRWRLRQLEGRRGFQFHQLDITDKKALERLFQDVEKDAPPLEAALNLAARAGVRQSVENPWVYFDTNVIGTLNLLELCREYGVRKFLLASTSSLYGANNPRPFREDANTDGPLSPYAASKKAAEALCYTYHYLHGFDITVVRYFTVYGPAGRPDMSLFRFVQWINEGRVVRVYGDGSQQRDFTYVEDIARGTVSGIRPMGYEVINLGSDRPIVLMDAIHLVEELVGVKAVIDNLPRHPADVEATWADIRKAETLLGWRPQTSLEKGLANLNTWYRKNRGWAKNIRTT